jgi:hypothetical protein
MMRLQSVVRDSVTRLQDLIMLVLWFRLGMVCTVIHQGDPLVQSLDKSESRLRANCGELVAKGQRTHHVPCQTRLPP